MTAFMLKYLPEYYQQDVQIYTFLGNGDLYYIYEVLINCPLCSRAGLESLC